MQKRAITNHSGMARSVLTIYLFLYLITLGSAADADPSTNAIADISNAIYSHIHAEPVSIKPATSNTSRLSGVKYSFFIKKPAKHVYDALAQIQQHAGVTDQILAAKVINHTGASATFAYTKVVDKKSVSRLQEWKFNQRDGTISIHNIGTNNPTDFTRIKVRKVRNKPYSHITIIHFTSEGWHPQYLQKAKARLTANTMVKKYRSLVDSFYDNNNQAQ